MHTDTLQAGFNICGCFSNDAKRVLVETNPQRLLYALNLADTAAMQALHPKQQQTAVMLINSLSDAIILLFDCPAALWESGHVVMQPGEARAVREIFEIDLLNLGEFLPVLSSLKDHVILCSADSDREQLESSFIRLEILLKGYRTPDDLKGV